MNEKGDTIKGQIMYMQDMKKMREDEAEQDKEDLKNKQDLIDAKKLLNDTAQGYINTMNEEITLNNAVNETEKNRIKTNKLREDLEKKWIASLDLSNLSTREQIDLIGKLTLKINEYINSLDKASIAQDNFAEKIGGKAYVGYKAVMGAKGISVKEGTYTEEEKAERRESGIVTAPSVEESINSDV